MDNFLRFIPTIEEDPESEDARYEMQSEEEKMFMGNINHQLKFDQWKRAGGKYSGCTGECTYVTINRESFECNAGITIWDRGFNDPYKVAQWFEEAGAEFTYKIVEVKFEAHPVEKPPGSRDWEVMFTIRDEFLENIDKSKQEQSENR